MFLKRLNVKYGLCLVICIVFIFQILVPYPAQAKKADAMSVPAAEIQGVTYKLAEDVYEIPAGVERTISKDGKQFTFKDYKGFSPQQGKTYIDPINKVAMKFNSKVTKNKGFNTVEISYVEPDTIFDEFIIPEQTVKLTPGNVSQYAKGVTLENNLINEDKEETTVFQRTEEELRSDLFISKEDYSKITNQKDYDFVFNIDNLVLYEYESSSSSGSSYGSSSGHTKITVTANGTIKLNKPVVKVKFDWNDDFMVVFEAAEEADIEITGEMSFDKEIRVPIAAFEVPFVLGRVYAGVYLVLSVDGHVTIIVTVDQGVDIRTGIAGELDWGIIPNNVNYNCSLDHHFNTGVSINGVVVARAAVVPEVGITVLEYELVNFGLWLGLEATIEITDSSIYTGVDAFFEVVAWVFDERYEIYEKRWPLLEKLSEEFESGYDITISKADALDNKVEGSVMKLGKPYTDNITIMVQNKSGKVKSTNTKCNKDGKFVQNVDLLGTDKVWIVVKDKSIEQKSDVVNTTVPYTVSIDSVDAFNDIIKGKVSPSYTGIVTLSVKKNYTAATGKNITGSTNSTTSGNLVSYNASCKNGVFSFNTNLSGGDEVKAKITFEGIIKESSFIDAALPLRINFAAKDDQTVGVVQNMEGDSPFRGDCKIKLSYVPANGLSPAIVEKTIRTIPIFKYIEGTNINLFTPSAGFICEEIKRPSVHPLIDQSVTVSLTYEGITVSRVCLIKSEKKETVELTIQMKRPMETLFVDPLIDPLEIPISQPSINRNIN